MILMLIILTLLMILDAMGDGFRARGWQSLHHFVEWTARGVAFGLFAYGVYFYSWTHPFWEKYGFYYDMLWLSVYYVSIYVAFFDQLFNVFAKRPFWSFDDRFWGRLMKRGGSILKVMALFTILAAIIRLTT